VSKKSKVLINKFELTTITKMLKRFVCSLLLNDKVLKKTVKTRFFDLFKKCGDRGRILRSSWRGIYPS
jgi:hypothetical protein